MNVLFVNCDTHHVQFITLVKFYVDSGWDNQCD